jgi:hypothetical protein
MKKFFLLSALILAFTAIPLAAAAPPIIGQTLELSTLVSQSGAMSILAANPAVGKSIGQPITAAALPTPTIITGDLSVSFPSLELQLSAQSQDSQKALASIHSYQRALVCLDILLLIGSLFIVVLIVARTKVLKSLGLTKLSDDTAAGSGAPGASSKA